MVLLQVSNGGLQALAAHCGAVSARLVAATPVPSGGLAIQATAGAVGHADSALVRAVPVLAGRAQTRGADAARAGAEFDTTDDTGAHNLATVSAPIFGVGRAV